MWFSFGYVWRDFEQQIFLLSYTMSLKQYKKKEGNKHFLVLIGLGMTCGAHFFISLQTPSFYLVFVIQYTNKT